MRFIDLVQRTRQECGISGEGKPTSVLNQTGEMARLVNWVSQSWVDIQMERPDWDFLRESVLFETEYGTVLTSGTALEIGCIYEIISRITLNFETYGERYTGTANTAGATYKITSAATLGVGDSVTLVGKQMYSVGSGITYDINLPYFKKWKNDSFRAYLKSAGIATQIILSQYYNYTHFRDFYMLGSRQLVTGRPLYITIDPETRGLILGFTPNDTYVVSAEYYRKPQVLALDADEPIIPDDYHMLIVYRAMKKYGMFEVANEQIATGREEYSRLMSRLVMEYTPIIEMGDSLI